MCYVTCDISNLFPLVDMDGVPKVFSSEEEVEVKDVYESPDLGSASCNF